MLAKKKCQTEVLKIINIASSSKTTNEAANHIVHMGFNDDSVVSFAVSSKEDSQVGAINFEEAFIVSNKLAKTAKHHSIDRLSVSDFKKIIESTEVSTDDLMNKSYDLVDQKINLESLYCEAGTNALFNIVAVEDHRRLVDYFNDEDVDNINIVIASVDDKNPVSFKSMNIPIKEFQRKLACQQVSVVF